MLLAVLVVQVLAPHTGGGHVGAAAGGIATLSAIGQTGVLLVRRRRPKEACLAILALYAVQVAAIDVVPPVALLLALWTLAAALPDQARAVRATAALTAASVVVIAGGEALHTGTGLGILTAGVTVAFALVALLRRSERGRLEAVRAESATAERLRIARDLHDLAGHGLGVVAVQSSTARMALDAGDHTTASTALAAVEASSRTALKEMRQLLGVLRDAQTAPAPGLADIDTLIEGVRAGGTTVSAHTEPVDVSPGTGLAAYRVVQEALTNAVKHSPGAAVDVRVAADGGLLHVHVTSVGARSRGPGTGTGLDGIAARVAALGGVSTIGPVADGWSVDVELPLEAS